MNRKQPPQDLKSRFMGEYTPPAAIATPNAAESMIQPIGIDDIENYRHNPRIYENPQFEAIKESIRDRGILQRLVVTRLPGAQKFTLCQGGNTRLRCLRELYQETSDPKFSVAWCEFREFRDETDLLVGHVIENEVRGNLNWHEQSRMVVHLFEAISSTAESELSARKFEKITREKGIAVRSEILHLHRYTVSVLEGLIPNLLRNGLGRTQTRRIYRADEAFRSIWNSAQLSEPEFASLFRARLAETDRFHEHGFDYENFRAHLSEDLGDRLNVVRSYLQRTTDYYVMHGGPLPKIEDMPRTLGTDGVIGHSTDGEFDIWENNDHGAIVQPPAPSTISTSISGKESRTPSPPPSQVTFLDTERIASKNEKKTRRFRGDTYQAAMMFALKTGNGDVLESMNLGYGFLVTGTPDLDRSPRPEARLVAAQAWWLLHELSAVHEALGECELLDSLSSGYYRSPLKEWFATADKEVLMRIADSSGIPRPAALQSMGEMIRSMDSGGLKVFTELLTKVQRLQAHFDTTATDPWHLPVAH